MSFLELYFYANIYILLFWILYKLIVQNNRNFQAGRLYIILSLISAPAMPFVQKGLATLIMTSTGIRTSSLSHFIYNFSSLGESLTPDYGKTFPEWEQVLTFFILAGSIVTLVIFLINHNRFYRLKRKSKLISSGFNKVYVSKSDFVPFIYNNSIFIPDSVSKPDVDIIIRHESFHYQQAHHFDNMLVQLFQVAFWLNPILYLLKRELFQLHEYQVDKLVVSSGIDPLDYKYVLIRCGAGNQKFVVANGLNNNNLKKRIIMMNTKTTTSGSWKYLLLVPAISVILLSLGFSSFDPATESSIVLTDRQEAAASDSLKINIVTLPENFKATDRNDVLMVLINKSSQIAVEGKLASEPAFESTLAEGFKSKIEKKYADLNPSMIRKDMKEIKIIVNKDRDTNMENYKGLLDMISSSIVSLQDFYSQELFSKPFKTLATTEKETILLLVPPVIYERPPMMIK